MMEETGTYSHEEGSAKEDVLLSAARWIALSRLPGITPSVMAKYFREPSRGDMQESQISDLKFEIEKIREELRMYETQGIRAVPIDSPAYPRALLDLRVPPVVLFMSGEMVPEDSRAIAIIGTRTPSLAGREVAHEIARRAVAAGFCVVSGLARGIDTEAHRSALRATGRSIAVLGNGLSSIYPPENTNLAARIRRRGALLSELWPEASVSRQGLLARDRLQAALSLAVVVVQTHVGCGSLTTARYAISCRRPLFAIKWQEEPFTIGIARLRQIGATIIEEDQLEEVFRAADTGRQPGIFTLAE